MDNTIDNTKTLLHVILSALKFVFGWRVFKGPEERLPQLFNYEKFIPNYKFYQN